GVYLPDGRSIYINTLYIRKSTGDFQFVTDRQIYERGENVNITVKSNIKLEGTISFMGETQDIVSDSNEAYYQFGIPQNVTSGTQQLEYRVSKEDGTILKGQIPIDIKGISVIDKGIFMDKDSYASNDTVNAKVMVLSDSDYKNVLIRAKVFHNDTEDIVIDKRIDLDEGRNEIPLSFKLPETAMGLIQFGYELVLEDGNDSLVLARDYKYFDAPDKNLPKLTSYTPQSPNSNGWYNSDVKICFEGMDKETGIKSITPGTFISSEGIDQTVTGEVYDYAGNRTTCVSEKINIDKTCPLIEIDMPDSIVEGDSLKISFNASDSLSGIQEEYAEYNGMTYKDSDNLALSKDGRIKFTAIDKAGNITVLYKNVTVLPFTAKVEKISLDKAYEIYKTNKGNEYLFIDVRSGEKSDKSTIPGAISLELTSEFFETFLLILNPDAKYIVFGNDDSESMLASETLRKMISSILPQSKGSVYSIDGGFNGWVLGNLPVGKTTVKTIPDISYETLDYSGDNGNTNNGSNTSPTTSPATSVSANTSTSLVDSASTEADKKTNSDKDSGTSISENPKTSDKDKNSNTKTVEDNGRIPSSTSKYKDIDNHWAKDSIIKLLNLGIIEGNENGLIIPDGIVKRDEAAVVLVKALKLNMKYKTDLKFKDANSIPKWAAGYVQAAVDAGLFEGYEDKTFRASNFLTRSEFITIMARAFKWGKSTSKPQFADSKKIPAWSSGFVAKAQELGVLKGYLDNTFRPLNKLTRAEIFAFVARVIDIKE
ncbi:MAG: S-layer homology domain-containing protein, partial [Bacillota bacterium]|nr:S-layer homology domain-containing protein [Bacillota bacterium]